MLPPGQQVSSPPGTGEMDASSSRQPSVPQEQDSLDTDGQAVPGASETQDESRPHGTRRPSTTGNPLMAARWREAASQANRPGQVCCMT